MAPGSVVGCRWVSPGPGALGPKGGGARRGVLRRLDAIGGAHDIEGGWKQLEKAFSAPFVTASSPSAPKEPVLPQPGRGFP